MKIESLMIPDPITINDKATIEEAIELMKDNSIRHLPVVTETNQLCGFLTLADLRLGLIPSMLGGVSLEDIIIKDPITVKPDDDIEVAAQIIYLKKISGMPVVDDHKKVLGIITETDILRTFIDMMGILTSSSRIDVELGDNPNEFARALQVIQNQGADVINVGMAGKGTGDRTYYFRLASCNTDLIRQQLEQEGFTVTHAMD